MTGGNGGLKATCRREASLIKGSGVDLGEGLLKNYRSKVSCPAAGDRVAEVREKRRPRGPVPSY